MALPEDYWASFEHSVSTLTEYLESVRTIAAYQAATRSRFVWRGVGGAAWPMHSKLVRAHIENFGEVPDERDLRLYEAEVLGSGSI